MLAGDCRLILPVSVGSAQFHERGVDDNTVQPRRDARAFLETANGSERGEESVLQRVARVIFAGEKALGNGE